MKKNILYILGFFNKLFYKNTYLNCYGTNEFYNIFKLGFFQKIIGFNRNIPWPVHWTTTVHSHQKIELKSRSPGISKNCHIDGRNGIIIGKNVWVGPGVKIISMNHDMNDYSKYINGSSITIGDNSWIGAGAIILPEVVLGQHTIVAAGSVVTKSFKDGNQIIGGNEAKVIRKLSKYNTNED